MHFFATATILATLFASTLAAPVTVNPAAPSEILKRDSINDCEDSSFQNDTSTASPLVADCLQLAANIAGGGTWTLRGTDGSRSLAWYGTCIFGASTTWPVKVGNQDIIDMINTSVDRFQWNGLIGASGSVDCQNEAFSGTNTIQWGIYHS